MKEFFCLVSFRRHVHYLETSVFDWFEVAKMLKEFGVEHGDFGWR
jgi:hypothetical protein